MHFKSAAIVGALALSQASAFTLNQNEGVQRGMTQSNEYAIRNMDQICISTQEVAMCKEDFVVQSYKNQKVNFHCVSRNSLEGQRLKQKVENDEVISEMRGKTVHVQGRVQVPTKCVEKNQVSNHEQRRRRQQQQHGQRVELIEQGEEQQFDQENQWETEQDQLTNDEEYKQYSNIRSQEENQWQRMQTLFNQYPQLTQQKLHQLVKSDSKYEKASEQLKDLVQQKQVTNHLMIEIQNNLPNFFSESAKKIYEAMQEQQKQDQQNQHHRTMEQSQQQRLNQLVGNYEQYKQLMKRVYVYIVKEALKLNQEAPKKFADTPELVRKVWEKLQRTELTRQQVQIVEDEQQKQEELLELDQTNQLIVDELVSTQQRNSQRQARRNLMKIINTGLMMENNPVFQQHNQQY